MGWLRITWFRLRAGCAEGSIGTDWANEAAGGTSSVAAATARRRSCHGGSSSSSSWAGVSISALRHNRRRARYISSCHIVAVCHKASTELCLASSTGRACVSRARDRRVIVGGDRRRSIYTIDVRDNGTWRVGGKCSGAGQGSACGSASSESSSESHAERVSGAHSQRRDESVGAGSRKSVARKNVGAHSCQSSGNRSSDRRG